MTLPIEITLKVLASKMGEDIEIKRPYFQGMSYVWEILWNRYKSYLYLISEFSKVVGHRLIYKSESLSIQRRQKT